MLTILPMHTVGLHKLCSLCFSPEHTGSQSQVRSQSVGCAGVSAVVGTTQKPSKGN